VDGQRILQPAVDTPRPSLTVVVNWMTLPKKQGVGVEAVRCYSLGARSTRITP
jgi:hypothetical protein